MRHENGNGNFELLDVGMVIFFSLQFTIMVDGIAIGFIKSSRCHSMNGWKVTIAQGAVG